MKRKNPQTSTDAFRSITPEMINSHHSRIISALRDLKTATYEQISIKSGFKDKVAVARRLNELVKMGVVYKPGLKLSTSSGRAAFCYALTSTPVQTPGQFAETVIKNAHKPDSTQTTLFE